MDNAVLQLLVTEARRSGIGQIVGTYRPTARNKLVQDHYAKLGFTLLDRGEDGTTSWELDVIRARVETPPMEVLRVGFDAVEVG